MDPLVKDNTEYSMILKMYVVGINDHMDLWHDSHGELECGAVSVLGQGYAICIGKLCFIRLTAMAC